MKGAAGDAELIARFLGGDADAVEEVHGWIARAASAFRRRLGGEWEDLLQEVRLEAFSLLRGGRYRGEASLRTYLWRVTAHTCIEVLRRRQRKPATTGVDLDGSLLASDPSPLDQVLGRERERMLLLALESMSEECRELWRLVADGLGYRETSRRMGVSEGTLRVRAHRCRQRAVEALRSNLRSSGTPNG
jgi:RNA polymerase sigma-70 factor, ECF subfamily